MQKQAMLEEMKDRVQRDIDHFNGTMPERVAIAWDGYLAALLEWGLISVDGHKTATDLLPPISNNPVIGIFLGRR